MAQTVGDFFWERLHQWGVRRIFGYPGDGINGLLGALDRAGDKFEFVQVRHEEMAAFMASAHAKFAGELGVCMVTSGPGAAHLLTGLYDAKLDHMPVLAIAGQQARTALGAHYQQEIDLQNMFADVADYVQTATVPAQVRHITDRAVRIAQSKRVVTALVFPNDLQELPMEQPPRKHGAVLSGVGWTAPRVVPTEPDLRQERLQRQPRLRLGEDDRVGMVAPHHPELPPHRRRGHHLVDLGDAPGDRRRVRGHQERHLDLGKTHLQRDRNRERDDEIAQPVGPRHHDPSKILGWSKYRHGRR